MVERTVLILDNSELIAQDVSEEVAALAPRARVEIVPSARVALSHAERLRWVDLLILSSRSATESAPELEAVTALARSILVIGDPPEGAVLPLNGTFYSMEAPFSGESLRRDLLGINLDGEPLFPH